MMKIWDRDPKKSAPTAIELVALVDNREMRMLASLARIGGVWVLAMRSQLGGGCWKMMIRLYLALLLRASFMNTLVFLDCCMSNTLHKPAKFPASWIKRLV